MEPGVGLGLATNIGPSNWSLSGDFVQFHFIEIQSCLEFPLEFYAPYIFPGGG